MEAVLFKVVELNTFAVGVQVIVFLVNTVAVAFVATVGMFPGVGQALTPVNWFK